jgi:methylenetetrahydrofolate reductase (NADPH)
MDQLADTSPRRALDPAQLRARLIALGTGATLDVSARDHDAGETCRALLAPGTPVHIIHAGGDSTPGIVAAAARLARAGLTPVPHVAARHLASFTRLNDFLARAAGEAGVERILLVGGDPERPAGPYGSSLEVLQTGLLQKHAIRQVGFAAYPEGHPRLSSASLAASLAVKVALCRRTGLAPFVLTQFCLDAAPIGAWLAAARGAGIDCPIHVGLAGPAPVATLARFAVRCGIGGSIGRLARGQTSVARLQTEAGPEPIVEALAAAPGTPIAGLHVYAFGGLARTAGWLAALQRGDFTLPPDGDRFRVN